MKHFLSFLFVMTAAVNAIEIPKSSLESVKKDVLTKLSAAKKENDHTLINKYETELKTLELKIKNFELEWLNYRKNMLANKPVTTESTAELNELEQLIKARSN